MELWWRMLEVIRITIFETKILKFILDFVLGALLAERFGTSSTSNRLFLFHNFWTCNVMADIG